MDSLLPSFITSDSGSVVGGILLVVYAAITSLRKRRDVTIAELEARIRRLEKRVKAVEADRDARVAAAQAERDRDVAEAEADRDKAVVREHAAQGALLLARRDLFKVRKVLADKDWPDPTIVPMP